MVEKNLRTASWLCYLAASLGIIFAVVYLFTPTVMPYHVRFMGKTQAQLDPKVGILLLMTLRVIGGAFLAISICVIMLARKLSQGIYWVRTPIICMVLISSAPALWVSLSVGHSAPWWLLGIIITLVTVSFELSRPIDKRISQAMQHSSEVG